MLAPLTTTVIALSVGGLALAILFAARDRLINDLILGVLALVEIGVIAQLVVGLTRMGSLSAEKATFAAYQVSLPFVLPLVAFLAIKEKSRWAMVTVAVGCFAVAVMTFRLGQIWSAYA